MLCYSRGDEGAGGNDHMALPLKEQRRRAFLSTRELAEKAAVAPDTIWRIEGGDYKRLRPATMRKIAAALGIHPSEITEFAARTEVG